MTEKTQITFGVQAGDVASNKTMQPFYMSLRKNFDEICQGKYFAELDEIAFILRIDGEFGRFNFEGFEKLRLQKKRRYITVDLGVTERIWQSGSEEIKSYLARTVLECLGAIIAKVKSAKLEVDAERLERDFHDAIEAFLKDTP